ncbi:hypothetical protein [Terrabacter aerolatus]|uniref:hypothetical protein n=1 Tax=Terrabacter aerolatus TaxID=422442 RepID=UPI0011BDBC8B|nr:hypothetical protein [Terrabacter aerolatus]
MSETRTAVGQNLVSETVSVAADLVGAPLRVVGAPFPGSRRTLVVRVLDGAGRSFVVKRYVTDEGREAYAREASALAAMTGFAQTPTLVAESTDPRLVVMGDLGDGGHLADALLGDDADRAVTTLSGWASAVAGLHTEGRRVRDTFEAGVRSRSSEPVELDYLPGQLAEAVPAWARLAAALDVTAPAGVFDVLATVPDRFRVDASSLSAADMCPDNNLVRDAGLVLLDFEFALWRPIAWDAAYLRVPWPTCWCAWSLEAAAAELALGRWREAVAVEWPATLGADFDHDLDLATEAWAWLAGSWCLTGLVDEEPARVNPVKPMPRMPDPVLRFLRTAAAGRALPELAEMALRLSRAVETTYAAGDVPLAPAFSRGAFR